MHVPLLLCVPNYATCTRIPNRAIVTNYKYAVRFTHKCGDFVLVFLRSGYKTSRTTLVAEIYSMLSFSIIRLYPCIIVHVRSMWFLRTHVFITNTKIVVTRYNELQVLLIYLYPMFSYRSVSSGFSRLVGCTDVLVPQRYTDRETQEKKVITNKLLWEIIR